MAFGTQYLLSSFLLLPVVISGALGGCLIFFVTGLSKFFGIALLQTRGAYLPLHFEAAMEIWQPVSLSSTANLNISYALYTDKPWNVLRMKEVNVQSSFGCNLSCYLHEPGITHLRCGIWPLNKRQVLMLC